MRYGVILLLEEDDEMYTILNIEICTALNTPILH